MSVRDVYPEELQLFQQHYFPHGVKKEDALILYEEKRKCFGMLVEELKDGIAVDWNSLQVAGLELWLAREFI